jgi:hypothetical protein
VAVALNCSVDPADMLALDGETDTELTVFPCDPLVEGEPPPHAKLMTRSESERKKAGIETKRQQWRLVPIDFFDSIRCGHSCGRHVSSRKPRRRLPPQSQNGKEVVLLSVAFVVFWLGKYRVSGILATLLYGLISN